MTEKIHQPVHISIVMPVYNAQKYIGECINSLLAQTFEDFELICVDDCSTDNSKALIAQYMEKDSRIQYIPMAQKSFAGVCRNRGFEAAQGQYTIFLDADDYFSPDLLQSAYDQALKTGADIVAFDYYEYDQQQKTTAKQLGIRPTLFPGGAVQAVFNRQDVPTRILDVVVPVPWNKLYRSEFIKKNNLTFLNTSTTNDVTFAALSLAFADSIAYLSQNLVYYRTNLQGSITSKKTKNMNNIILAVDAVEKRINASPLQGELQEALAFFIVSKYAFSHNAYATSADQEDFKTHYEYIRNVYRQTYPNCTRADINDDPLYDLYKYIKNNSYQAYIAKQKVKKAVKAVLKKCLRLGGRLGLPFSTYNELKLYYRVLKNAAPRSDALNKSEVRKEKIIVSLTTYPKRNLPAALVLKCLESQSVKPDKILLVLAESQYPKKKLPGYLRKHQKIAGVEVVFTDDLRSHKKYHYAMKHYPNDLVLTFDDDLYVPKNAIEQLYQSYQAHPQAVSTLYAHGITLDETGHPLPYYHWKRSLLAPLHRPLMQIMPLTGGGTLYPPGAVHPEAFNIQNMKKLSFGADDIWIKMMALLQGTPAVLVKPYSGLLYIEGTQEDTLWTYNRTENDVQLANVLAAYNDYSGKSKTLTQRLLADSLTNPNLINEWRSY